MERTERRPKRRWKIGAYEFRMYGPTHWECEARSLGSYGRTPWTAWWDQRQWEKMYNKSPWNWMDE